MSATDIFNSLFDKHVRPQLHDSKITITFPDPPCFAKPLSVVLLKLMETSDFHILTSKNFDGLDVPSEYGAQIGYKRDFGSIAYMFIQDKRIFLDYTDFIQFYHCALGRLVTKAGKDAADGAIKFQFSPNNYADPPFPVYPFVFPGPNDYGDVDHYVQSFDLRYREQFEECCKNNKFDCSIFARWNKFPSRTKFTELCESIPGADVSLKRDLGIHDYMDRMSKSKFAIAARGKGKFSHREMEACAIGVPLLRENRDDAMWRPFLPGEHYIEIKHDNLYEVFDYYDHHYDEALEIGRNGLQYYENNHTTSGLQSVFKEIVDTVLGKREWKQL